MKASDWISVEEPPKKDGLYWVRVSYPHGDISYTARTFSGNAWRRPTPFKSKVTHWMPIVPPEKKDD